MDLFHTTKVEVKYFVSHCQKLNKKKIKRLPTYPQQPAQAKALYLQDLETR